MENPSESGGSFDASGAFHGGTVYSDDEEVLIKLQIPLITFLLSHWWFLMGLIIIYSL